MTNTFIISLVTTFDGISLGSQYIRYDYDSAVQVAFSMVKLRIADKSPKNLEEVLDTITQSAGWVDDEWAVLIGQPEEE